VSLRIKKNIGGEDHSKIMRKKTRMRFTHDCFKGENEEATETALNTSASSRSPPYRLCGSIAPVVGGSLSLEGLLEQKKTKIGSPRLKATTKRSGETKEKAERGNGFGCH